MSIHDTEICISLEYGELECIPAAFDYETRWQAAETDVGIMQGYAELETDAELLSAKIGDLSLSRSQMIDMAGLAEVERIEAVETKWLEDALEYGELEAA